MGADVERRALERRRLRQIDGVAALAHEQLARGDVHRAGGLQRSHAVEATCGEVAQRERERTHDPKSVVGGDDRRRLLRDGLRQRRLERQDLHPLLRPLVAQTDAIEERAAAALRRPLLARAEVVDVPEDDVPHLRPLRDGDREREVRNPALRVQRAVDRVEDDVDATVAVALLAELLRHEREVEAVLAVGALEPRDDRAFRLRVDGRRLVSALAATDDRLALRTRRQIREHRAHVVDGAATDLEPLRQTGWNNNPETSFGKKYVDFCGITSPLAAISKTSSIRGGRTRTAAPLESASRASGVYATTFGPNRSRNATSGSRRSPVATATRPSSA